MEINNLKEEESEIKIRTIISKKIQFNSKSEISKMKRKGIIEIGEKGQIRKQEIIEKIKKHETLSDFMKENIVDYKWAYYNGLTNDLFRKYPDYIRKIKYREQQLSLQNDNEKKLRKAKRNAAICRDINEFEKRSARYEYCAEFVYDKYFKSN